MIIETAYAVSEQISFRISYNVTPDMQLNAELFEWIFICMMYNIHAFIWLLQPKAQTIDIEKIFLNKLKYVTIP